MAELDVNDMGTPTDVPTTEAPTTAPIATPTPVKRNWLQTIGHDIAIGIIDIKSFVENVPKVLKAWNSLAPEVKTIALQLFHDVMTIVSDVSKAAADAKALDVPDAITVSEATWTAIQQLIADAKAGNEEILASLKVLGITI